MVTRTALIVGSVLAVMVGTADSTLSAQSGLPPATASTTAAVHAPKVSPNRTITFAIAAPKATRVELELGDGPPLSQRLPMTKDAQGVWRITTGPLEPDVYRYYFLVDGFPTIDTHNQSIDFGRSTATNFVEVPGSPPRFDESTNVPHGTLHIREYTSAVLKLSRRMYVWVPPQYDTDPVRRFPVLYLRHGNSNTEMSWWSLGRAGVIAENLIATGAMVPMIIVTPNGYQSDTGAGSSEEGINLTSQELLRDIIPLIDRNYRTLPGAHNRAIAGLSMGAGQAFVSGLRNLDTFAWIGAFSSGVISDPTFQLSLAVPGMLDDAAATNERVRLLFLSCGAGDPRTAGYQRLMSLLNEKGIRHSWFSTPGGHEFKVWRHSLARFLPLLFKGNT